MMDFVRTGVLLLLLLVAYCVVGSIDMHEAERMAAEPLVTAHVTLSEADTFAPVERIVHLPITERECSR